MAVARPSATAATSRRRISSCRPARRLPRRSRRTDPRERVREWRRPCPAPPPGAAAAASLPGCVVERNIGAPSGRNFGSMAMERPAVSGTPSAPLGPMDGSSSGASRKNTTLGLLSSTSWRRCGFAASQARMAGMFTWSMVMTPWSARYLPIERYGWPFWSSYCSRMVSPVVSCTRPEPWTSSMKASSALSIQTISWPASPGASRDCARL